MEWVSAHEGGLLQAIVPLWLTLLAAQVVVDQESSILHPGMMTSLLATTPPRYS